MEGATEATLIYVKIITYNQGRVITDSTELVMLLYAMATLLHHLCGVWRFNDEIDTPVGWEKYPH